MIFVYSYRYSIKELFYNPFCLTGGTTLIHFNETGNPGRHVAVRIATGYLHDNIVVYSKVMTDVEMQ